MMDKNSAKRYDSLLFNYETVARTDFRDGRIKPVIETSFIEKPSCQRVRPQRLKDVHTLTDWRKPVVPFNLWHTPKDIVRTDPWILQEPYEVPKDLIQKEVQKTRPRLVMTPAVSMDDIDESSRKMLIADVYTTALMRAERGAGTGARAGVRAPLSPQYAPAEPIFLLKLRPPLVPAEWRMDSVAWDGRQLRSYCVPTREFWRARTPYCDVCKQTAERKIKWG